jgi:predicted lipid-binding transport protein (Tim44 family)
MRVVLFVLTGCVLLFALPYARAADLYVYPAKGQSPEQQSRDEGECYGFAKQQTSFDPMATPTATSAAPEQRGSVVGGAARGALVGAAVGAVAGDTGEGAAMGAAAGGLMGGMRRNSSRREQDAWEQEQAQIYAGKRDNYNRAYAACLQGRGYTTG